jgi:hypothetical protein
MKLSKSKCINLRKTTSIINGAPIWRCSCVDDSWFNILHEVEEDCPFYKTLYDQLLIEKQIAPRVEAFTGKPFKSCINRDALRRILGVD